LIGQLTALLGEPTDAPLDFEPALDLAAGYGQGLARYALMAAVDLDHPDSMLLNPLTMGRFAQMIMTGLLLSHPHTHTEALRRRERPIAPRDIRRAIDYLEAHLDTPVTLPDLVAASGVAGRTLLQHFRDTQGVSPIRYLRNARFRKGSGSAGAGAAGGERDYDRDELGLQSHGTLRRRVPQAIRREPLGDAPAAPPPRLVFAPKTEISKSSEELRCLRPAAAGAILGKIRSSQISKHHLDCGRRQQLKGGDPVSHCQSPRSPAPVSWILASMGVPVA
jgi:hypothetical protein